MSGNTGENRSLGEVFYMPAKGSRLQRWLSAIAAIVTAPGASWDEWVLSECRGAQCTAGHLKAGMVQRGGTGLCPGSCPWTGLVPAAAQGQESARPPCPWGCFSH